MKNIIPAETLIYKELKSKFEVSDPDLWKEVSMNIWQVIMDTNHKLNFLDDEKDLLACFKWNFSSQGHDYWEDIWMEAQKYDN